MIKKNIVLYLLIVGCSNALHGTFSEWTDWLYKEGFLRGTAELLLNLSGTLTQLPIGKKIFGLDELTMINLENQKIQAYYHLTQQIMNLRQIVTNAFFKNLSPYDQLVVFHLSLSAAQVSRNTFMIK